MLNGAVQDRNEPIGTEASSKDVRDLLITVGLDSLAEDANVYS